MLNGRDLNRMLKAQQLGLIITQFLGTAPNAGLGVIGSIALDSKDGKAYSKSAGGWTQIAGFNLGNA